MGSQKRSNIGILGGTFDPIHFGHLFIAEWIKTLFNLNKMFFIPTGIPPHKNNVKACKEHRLEMVKMAISDNKSFEVLCLEIECNRPSYTVNTLKNLKNKGFQNINFIMGADSLLEIQTWYNYQKIPDFAKLIVVPRSNDNISILKTWTKSNLPEFYNNIIFVDIPIIEISSTTIRKRIKQNLSIRYMTTDKIINYIAENHLYNGY